LDSFWNNRVCFCRSFKKLVPALSLSGFISTDRSTIHPQQIWLEITSCRVPTSSDSEWPSAADGWTVGRTVGTTFLRWRACPSRLEPKLFNQSLNSQHRKLHRYRRSLSKLESSLDYGGVVEFLPLWGIWNREKFNLKDCWNTHPRGWEALSAQPSHQIKILILVVEGKKTKGKAKSCFTPPTFP
jgi:hypothetical protein